MIAKSEDFDLFYRILNKHLKGKGLADDFILDDWNRTIRDYARHKSPRNIKNIGGFEDGF